VAEKWFDVATQNLNDNDTIESSWDGTYDGKSGHIVLSKERLLFVEEEEFSLNFARARVMTPPTVLLDIPYDQIAKITENDEQLILTQNDDRHYSIKTPYPIKARRILKELLSTIKS
jgi:hypothetical protein